MQGMSRVWGIALALFGAACSSVPHVQFQPDTQGEDGSAPGQDGGSDDGGVIGPDGSTPPPMCDAINNPPANGICCGTVTCVHCSTTGGQCNKCLTLGCGADQVCCTKGSNVVCSSASACK
jgi:hypothetical protein